MTCFVERCDPFLFFGNNTALLLCTTSNDLLIDLARIGLGIAFVPDYCISPDSEDVFILHTKEELPERELAIAYNEHLPLSRASMEFLSYFRDKTC